MSGRYRRSGWTVALLAPTLSAAVFAQTTGQLEVRAYLQPDFDIQEAQTVRLVVEVDGGARGSEIGVAGLDGLRNLRVVGGPSSHFSTRWSNGRQTSQTQLSYTLLPGGAGPAEVPALTLSIGGRAYRTEPIRVDVAASSPGRAPAPAPARPGSGASTEPRADLFLQARLGKSEAWVGEAVPLSVLLYSTHAVAGRPNLVESPSLSSFWVEDIEVDAEDSFNTKINGRVYVAVPQILKILVPQTSGETEIEPFVMQVPVQVRNPNDPFDRLFPFGRTTKSIVRESQPLKLDVSPLPTTGRMDDFSGAVGVFTLKVGLDQEEARANEAVSLTATVEGEGFLRAVAAPIVDPPPDIKLFDPKVSASARAVRGKLVSRKTWEWILIPLSAGEVQLPPVRFQYFDTESGSYKLANKELPLLVVRQGDSVPEPALAGKDIQLQHRDLAFIKPLRGRLQDRAPRAHERTGFLIALFSPLAWAPLAIIVGRHRARLQRNLGLARSRKARSRARQRLRRARGKLEDPDAPSFHEEVARALVGYVADRFDRAPAGLTYQVADELLAGHGLDESLRRRFRACLEVCDFARYVPSSQAPERRGEILNEAAALIDAMERFW